MPTAYSAERSVLLKILLHSAGHPSQSVNGVLLGKLKPKAASEAPQDGQGTPRAAQQQVAVEIVDALPFLHTFLTLAPMTEVALVQAEAYAHSRGLQLVGYYHANERLSDLELGPAGRKIADRIHAHTPQACALLVDNSKLADYLQQKSPTFLQLYVKESQRGWVQTPGGSLLAVEAATVPQLFLDYYTEGRHQEVVDFDDHLNNLEKDWFNTSLLS